MSNRPRNDTVQHYSTDQRRKKDRDEVDPANLDRLPMKYRNIPNRPVPYGDKYERAWQQRVSGGDCGQGPNITKR
jgi:hypothetical protein